MGLLSLQGVLENVVANIIVALLSIVAAAMLTWWLQRAHEAISLPLLVIIGIGVYGLLMFAINQTKTFLRRGPDTIRAPLLPSSMSAETLEATIRSWMDDFHYQVQKNPDREDRYFSLTIRRAPKNIPIEIMKTRREREQFLTLISVVSIPNTVKGKWNSISERDRQRISHEVVLELNRQRVASRIDYQQSLTVQSMVLIDELTQSKLIDRIDDIDYAISVVISKLTLLLDYDESLEKKEN
jgi:hypothetical protein